MGARRLALPPAGLIALEDTPAGIASARQAGICLVIGVTTGHPSQHLRAAGADHTVPDLTELADAVAHARVAHRRAAQPRVAHRRTEEPSA